MPPTQLSMPWRPHIKWAPRWPRTLHVMMAHHYSTSIALWYTVIASHYRYRRITKLMTTLGLHSVPVLLANKPECRFLFHVVSWTVGRKRVFHLRWPFTTGVPVVEQVQQNAMHLSSIIHGTESPPQLRL